MDNWSSIREFYRLYRPELRRYGIAAMLILGAMITGRWALAGFTFLAIPVMYAYDRWGEPWRKRGEMMTKKKPKP